MDILLPEPKLPKGEQQIRVVSAEIRRVGDEKDRTLEFIASDETTDRYRDVVTTEGWEVTAYKKNPVFLWGHGHGTLPIGRSVKTFVGEHPARKGKEALIQHVQFAQKGTHYDDWPVTQPTPETVYRMYTSEPRMLNAVSVGFLPLAYEPIMEKTNDGKEQWTGGFKFTKQELLELSAVTVPANPNALLVNGFDHAGLRAVDMIWLARQCENVLNSLTNPPNELLEQWREALAKAKEYQLEESRTISIPAEPTEPKKELITIVEEPAQVVEEAAAPVEAPAAVPAEPTMATTPTVVVRKVRQMTDAQVEKLQQIMSLCQELMDGEDEGEEEQVVAPQAKKVEEPKSTGVDPTGVKELGQQADELLQKLGVAGASSASVTISEPTASTEENPYALLLDATQSATGMLVELNNKK